MHIRVTTDIGAYLFFFNVWFPCIFNLRSCFITFFSLLRDTVVDAFTNFLCLRISPISYDCILNPCSTLF